MIISAHDNIEKQNFFQFELENLKLNACYLKEYTSTDGLDAIKAVISMSSKKGQNFESDFIADIGHKNLTNIQLELLKTIDGIHKNDVFYNVQLSKELYNKLFLFLEFAKKIHPFICRAQFMQNDVIVS
jgi:hypothetical protein